jgi:hypothetical protein
MKNLATGMLDSGKGGREYYATYSPDDFATIGDRFPGEKITNIEFVKSLNYKDFLLST